ncbi:hypothetical protein COT20_01275 [bacterium (Candidatus Gribaldobacteria) CG08_land_8_20_14_0_20_39_15]|uniref:Uncharacterized protein n=1 Tax=bacterium (Candidatus Gribaldobacteria) CG08_land_8_20_14_0_20_39_15 TaxID=2014273 RepID=A0A2M6XUN2_9BACT|nr:MAG: hypothetical protein COT20_01275 [bacterium (Candidatus Gribaldobacteria) CG08_land_8_20_14_0_20_39_15]
MKQMLLLTTMALVLVFIAGVVNGGDVADDETVNVLATIPQLVMVQNLDDVVVTYSSYDYDNNLFILAGSDAFKVITNCKNTGIISVATGGTLVSGFSEFSASVDPTIMVCPGATSATLTVGLKADLTVDTGTDISTGGTITVTAIATF